MSGVGASMVVRHFGQFRRMLNGYDQERRDAGEIAARVEAYRLRKKMKKDISRGKIAGRKFAPLRLISSASNPASKRKPLGKLNKAVRYWAVQEGAHKVMSIGFNDGPVRGMSGAAIRKNQLSFSWQDIAKKHQEGFEVSASRLRRALGRKYAQLGGQYEKKNKHPFFRKFFFLKKSTRVFKTPARPIVEPFWAHHKAKSRINIVNNFNRKMRGERI